MTDRTRIYIEASGIADVGRVKRLVDIAIRDGALAGLITVVVGTPGECGPVRLAIPHPVAVVDGAAIFLPIPAEAA